MKKTSYFLLLLFLVSCTSNTIYKKPKDLIPRDTMTLLVKDMMIASSAKFVKNKNNQRKINYMSFVFDKYNIDSTRFQSSNLYYTSKIDLYQEILTDVNALLEKQKEFYTKISAEKDSLRKDSIKKNSVTKELLDTIKKARTS